MGEEKLKKHLSIFDLEVSDDTRCPRVGFLQLCLVAGKQAWHCRAPSLDGKEHCREEQGHFDSQTAFGCWIVAGTLEISLQSSNTWRLPSRSFAKEVVCWKLVASEILPITRVLNFSPTVEQRNVMVRRSLASLPPLHFSPCYTKLRLGTPFQKSPLSSTV